MRRPAGAMWFAGAICALEIQPGINLGVKELKTLVLLLGGVVSFLVLTMNSLPLWSYKHYNYGVLYPRHSLCSEGH